MNAPRRQSHLEYYRQHGIAPVRYDLSDMAAHLQRRAALYDTLGLPPLAFRDSRVLEVAAGTGHNSLYLAQLMPARLLLLEPNATAVEHIAQAYAAFGLPHTKPEVATSTLEEFNLAEPVDIVLCENWLGSAEHELGLLDKLAGMLSPGGVLALTTVSPIGFVPNLLRRFLVPRLIDAGMDFEARSQVLEAAFAPHLRSLAAMTRSVRDWVQDNMLNPAYFGLCLSSPAVVERLGGDFDVLGTSPAFAEDWRWFKSMTGAQRRINGHFLDEYWRKAHNFLDCRETPFAGDATANRRLERAARDLLAAIEAHEDAFAGRMADPAALAGRVRERLDGFVAAMPAELAAAQAGLREFSEMAFDLPRGAVGRVAAMTHFGSLFGRETSYLALMRRPLWATAAGG